MMNIIMHERLEGEDFNLLERKRQREKKGNPFSGSENDALPQPRRPVRFSLSPCSDVTNEKMMMKDSGTKCTIFGFSGLNENYSFREMLFNCHSKHLR